MSTVVAVVESVHEPYIVFLSSPFGQGILCLLQTMEVLVQLDGRDKLINLRGSVAFAQQCIGL